MGILILLMLLQSVVLEQIATTNLLTFTLAQTQLQNNFKIILAALKNHDSVLTEHNEKMNSLELLLKNSQQNQQKKDMSGHEITKDLKLEIDTVKKQVVESDLRLNKIEDNLETVLRVNPQNEKNESQISMLKALIKQLEQKMTKVEGNVGKIELKVGEIDTLSSNIQQQKLRVSTLQSNVKQKQANIQKIQQEILKIKNQLTSIRQRRPSTAKLNSLAQNENEMKRLNVEVHSIKEDMNKKISVEIQSRLGQLFGKNSGSKQKEKESMEEVNKKMKKISDDVWKLNEQIYSSQRHIQEKDAFSQSQIDHLMKKINELGQRLDFFKGQNTLGGRTVVSARQPLSTEWSPPPSAFPDLQKKTIDESPPKEFDKETDTISFRKEIIDKLKQQRSDFNKAIKRLDFAANKKEQDLSKLNELQERILRLQHLMEGKLDEDGLKKWMKYIENKIGYLYRIVNVEATQEDACIARKNWICLSCDKKLEAYKGKVGSHLIGSQLKSRGIEQDVVGGGMLFRNKSKYELPQFKK